MSTVDELVYYCEEKIPNGALLLTGGWGCGKTYLIEHEFQNRIKDTAFIIRVSLFGISSTPDVDNLLKEKYIECYFKDKLSTSVEDTAKKWFESVKNMAGKLSEVSPHASALNAALSLKELIPAKPKINGKNVIIVFDDLERFQGNTTDALGLINQYCENEGFHVIIVMNPEELKEDENSQLSYSKIKEKVINRTVHHTANYHTVLSNIIKSITSEEDIYRSFLSNNLNALLPILGIHTVEDTIAPINLRSVKSAMVDFRRIFDTAGKGHISQETTSKIYCNFVCAVILAKSGIPCNADTFAKYPLSQIKYVPQAAINWVEEGEYDEASLLKQIEAIQEWEKESHPYNIILRNDLREIEDNILREGFDDYLNRFYTGQFDLMDYVDIVEKSCQARRLGIRLPQTIDWDRVGQGLKKSSFNAPSWPDNLRFDTRIGKLPNPQYSYRKYEKALIEAIKDKYHLELRVNANAEYIRIMRLKTDALFQELPQFNYNLGLFDSETAKATVAAYMECSNQNKAGFIRCLDDFIGTNLSIHPSFNKDSRDFLWLIISEINQVITDQALKDAVTEALNEVVFEQEVSERATSGSSLAVYHLNNIKNKLLSKYENAQHHYTLAKKLHEKKKYDQALAEIEKAVEIKPSNAEYQYSLSLTLFQLQRYPEAVEAASRAVKYEAETAEYHNMLGAALYKMENYSKAIAAARVAVALEPYNPLYHYNLGISLHDNGDYAEALEQKAKAAEESPQNPEYRNSLGITWHAMGHYDKAETEKRKAIEYEFQNPWYHESLAITLEALGRREEAEAERKIAADIRNSPHQ